MPADQWVPQAGDRLVVDTQANEAYLIHDDGNYTEFPVLTGQRRTVHYLGLTYNAATPEARWTVEDAVIKGDHITFGPTGLFLRLYRDGESTAYGIHGEAYFQQMEDSNDHYRSMGCILVSEDMLKVIKQTYDTNGNTLEVATTYGLNL